jgi:hypothetical protein
LLLVAAYADYSILVISFFLSSDTLIAKRVATLREHLSNSSILVKLIATGIALDKGLHITKFKFKINKLLIMHHLY